MFTSFVVLIVRLLQITDNSQLSSGPTAIHILNDLTSIEQRLLSTEQQSKTLTTETSPLQMT